MEMEQQLSSIKKTFFTLTQLNDSDMLMLRNHFPTTSTWGNEIAEAFYVKLLGYSDTKKIFSSSEMADRHKTLIDWYRTVAKGNIDENFWNHQWYVGLVHIKRGVKNEFMTSMMSEVQRMFSEKTFSSFDAQTAHSLSLSFNKITNGVSTLIVEGYRLGYLQAIFNSTGMNFQLMDNLVKTAIDELMRKK